MLAFVNILTWSIDVNRFNILGVVINVNDEHWLFNW